MLWICCKPSIVYELVSQLVVDLLYSLLYNKTKQVDFGPCCCCFRLVSKYQRPSAYHVAVSGCNKIRILFIDCSMRHDVRSIEAGRRCWQPVVADEDGGRDVTTAAASVAYEAVVGGD